MDSEIAPHFLQEEGCLKKSKFSRITDSRTNFVDVGLMLKTMKRDVRNCLTLLAKESECLFRLTSCHRWLHI